MKIWIFEYFIRFFVLLFFSISIFCSLYCGCVWIISLFYSTFTVIQHIPTYVFTFFSLNSHSSQIPSTLCCTAISHSLIRNLLFSIIGFLYLLSFFLAYLLYISISLFLFCLSVHRQIWPIKRTEKQRKITNRERIINFVLLIFPGVYFPFFHVFNNFFFLFHGSEATRKKENQINLLQSLAWVMVQNNVVTNNNMFQFILKSVSVSEQRQVLYLNSFFFSSFI